MFPRILSVRPLQDFAVELTFTDGISAAVDLSHWIKGHGGVFLPLQNDAYFQQVRVDPEAGTIVWPNGVDFCPDVLYTMATKT